MNIALNLVLHPPNALERFWVSLDVFMPETSLVVEEKRPDQSPSSSCRLTMSMSTPTVTRDPFHQLSEDLSRSLEDAFQFTSVSAGLGDSLGSSSAPPRPISPIHLQYGTPPSSPLSGNLKMEHSTPNSRSTSLKTSTESAADSKSLLDAFLDDDTPVTLKNIPMRNSSASLLISRPKITPSTPTKPSLPSLEKDQNGKLIYRITPSDTLEGLSLRFGIKVADLKKANHLFNSRDFGIRKTFIIPMDPVQYEKYQKEIDYQNAKEQARREEIISDFIEKTNTDKEIATVYLTDSHFHLERALERYHLENMTTTEPFSVPISRPHTTLSETHSTSSSWSHKQPDLRKSDLDDIFDL